MTKTASTPTTQQRRQNLGPVMGLAAFAIILALGVIYYYTTQDDETAEVVSPSTDLAIIEAGVAALYSGDADRAAQLFELEATPDGDPAITDEQIRDMARYQKAIGGSLTIECTAKETPGEYSCRVPYHNMMTDAIGYRDPGDRIDVVVEDGVITRFAIPEHSKMLVSMTAYLARELGDSVPDGCHQWYSPLPEDCVALQVENLDGWAAFYKTDWSKDGPALLDEIVSIFDSEVCQQGTAEECDRAHYEAITAWVESLGK